MATISFTKHELENLFREYGMLIESCNEAIAEESPRPDDKLIRAIYKKIIRVKFPDDETLKQWQTRNYKRLDRILLRLP